MTTYLVLGRINFVSRVNLKGVVGDCGVVGGIILARYIVLLRS